MPTIKKILGVSTTTAAPPPCSSELFFSCDKIVTKLLSNWPDPGLKNHRIEIEITKNKNKKKKYKKKLLKTMKKSTTINKKLSATLTLFVKQPLASPGSAN